MRCFPLLSILCCFFSSHRRILDVHRSLSVSCVHPHMYLYITGGSDSKKSAHKAGDPGLIPGLGRSPGEGNGNPPQYSCLGNPMNRGAWWATVHGVTKCWTWLSKDDNISTGRERQKVCVWGCLSCTKSKIQFYLYWSVRVWLWSAKPVMAHRGGPWCCLGAMPHLGRPVIRLLRPVLHWEGRGRAQAGPPPRQQGDGGIP